MTPVNLTLFDLAGHVIPLPADVVRIELTVPAPPAPPNSWAWWPAPAQQAVWTAAA
jgi:hypothetical protein